MALLRTLSPRNMFVVFPVVVAGLAFGEIINVTVKRNKTELI